MKKIYYIFLFLLSFQLSYSADNFKLVPIIFDFHGSLAWDSTIIAYGSGGAYWISYDEFETYEIKKVFDKGTIIKMIKEEDKIAAITKDGLLAVSYDNSTTWNQLEKLNLEEDEELLYEFVKIDSNILCRSKWNLYLLDNNLKIIKKETETIKYVAFNFWYSSQRNPVFYFKEKIYTIIDTNIINIYDKNLNFEKTIKINDYVVNDSYMMNLSFFPIDENHFGLQIGSKFFKFDETFLNYEILVKEPHINFTYGHYNQGKIFYNFGFQEYILNKEKKFELLNEYTYNFVFLSLGNNFRTNIYRDKIIMTGSSNFIAIADLVVRNKIKFITLGSGRTKENLVLSKTKLNNELLTLRQVDNSYGSDLFTIKINDNKFTGVIDALDTNNKSFVGSLARNATVQTVFYDDNNGLLYMGSNHKITDENALFVSDNMGKSFKRHNMNFVTNYAYSRNHEMSNSSFGNYLQGTYNMNILGKEYASIDVFTKDFKKLFRKQFTNEIFMRNDILDTNTYFVLSQNTEIKKLSYKSTTDKGENWEVYKEYPTSVYLLESKELELNGNKIWAYTYFDFATDKFHLDVIDVEERKVYSVFEKELTQDEIDTWDYIGFDAAKEKFYLSFYNTLMVSSNIFDENIKWETFNYPNNGKVNKKFQIFDKTIFSRYEDDKNEDNVYWINGIEMVGDPTSVENIEEVSYLYTMPPYPNPTVSEVTAKFYWDSRIDIDNSEIGVFDITGNKVFDKENLTLDKLNEWSGNIKWNCVGQPKGTYLIKIQHGNNTKSLKVVVN